MGLRFRNVALALLALLVGAGVFVRPDGAQATTGPALTVDINAGRHPISPLIYGINLTLDGRSEQLASALHLPLRRWGGNSTTRYHYLYDTTNRGSDWFFENQPGPGDPAQLPNGSETDRFVDHDRQTGTSTMLTVPLIGWAPKARDYSCGFSVAKYGPQYRIDSPWRPDCGTGERSERVYITGNDPHDTSIEIGPSYIHDWLQHLTTKYGTAANGGVRFYNLDNEPDLWHDTHRDVHPVGVTYDELRDKTYQIAAAVKAADPSAQTLGPAGWGYNSFFWSGYEQQYCGQHPEETNCWWQPPERGSHGGLLFANWYLQQMRAYEQAHGVRILDYFDMHIYPQQAGVALKDAGSATTQALRLRSTRQLWDPTYVDESWIATPVRFIPRMRELVNANYSGTKLAITEYNWGGLEHINGALAQADVLGIFGREQVDLATMWDPPHVNQPGAYAFRMYLNYDGLGGAFGETGVQASSANQDQLAIYAAQRSSDGSLTLIVINKTLTDLTSAVSISRLPTVASAQVYRYSEDDLTAIVREADQPVATDGFTATFPASSITLFDIPTDGRPTTVPVTVTARPTQTPTSTATVTATPTVTSTPSPTPLPSSDPVRLQYRDSSDPAANVIKPHFNIVNESAQGIPLSELTIRYWYTADGNQSQNYWCDYAFVGCSIVRGQFVQLSSPRPDADYYLEIRFTGGTLAPNSTTGEILNRFSKSDWSNYTKTNDYSFDSSKTSFADWNRVTLYRNGTLIWGVEP